MSMTIPTTALGALEVGHADHHLEQRATTAPSEPGPRWSLAGDFDDSRFAASIGAKPILHPHAA